MEEIRRDPIKWFIEGFGVLTGFFFVVSGLFNAVSFYVLWRLNYFLIASPSDVVMSAFIFGLIVMIGGMVASVGYGVYAFLRGSGLHVPPTLLDAVFGNRSLSSVFGKLLEDRSFKALYDKVTHLFIATALAVALLNALAWLAEGRPKAWTGALRPFWYETGLNVSHDSKLREACKGQHVAWLGASAAVIECRDQIRVIHKLDDLQTVRRFR